MKYLYNDPRLKDRRRELRKNMTEAEELLWGRVRKRRMQGYKFLRQYSVGPYILDFFCVALQLGIEVDGRFHGHSDNAAYDRQRTDFLESHDIEVIRFWNNEVLQNTDSVVARIKEKIVTVDNSPLEEGE